MKGVALTINPDLCFIDLSHQILPQNIAQGSFLLGINHRFFPKNTIHVTVVDPGVGTDRRPILLTTPCGRFVAPDNGLLSGVIASYLDFVPTEAGQIKLPATLSAVHLTNPEYWRHPVSQTFHGRDIFTPAAAHLSLGIDFESLGQSIDSLYYLPIPEPTNTGGKISGQVIYTDVYGNLVTNIHSEILQSLDVAEIQLTVEIMGRSIPGLSRTFNSGTPVETDGLIALVGSHGYLEIAVANGNAAIMLGAGEGESVLVASPCG